MILQVSWHNTKKFVNSSGAQVNHVTDQTRVQANHENPTSE